MKSVYLAGPFFNENEIKNIECAEKILGVRGLDLFSPMRHGAAAEYGTAEWAEEIFETDRAAIEKSDLVVALYYGSTSDSGTAWECGYATALGKPVVLVHMDRNDDSNVMLHVSAATNIYFDSLADYDFEHMPVFGFEGKMF
ncbi:MAG: nucleoside 2-deoxyribosyltransferase [Clostridia bacterium]|nr:nucleoside 2-deoxyribosyltransferase [Clostridia bacterium]